MTTTLILNPWDVASTETASGNSYTGEFWLSSRAFSFPVHRWQDDVPSRLCDMAHALNALTPTSSQSTMVFGEARYTITFELDPAGADSLKVIYADQKSGGLLYQERVNRIHLEKEVVRALRGMLEVAIKRRWSEPATSMSDAIALPGLKQAGQSI